MKTITVNLDVNSSQAIRSIGQLEDVIGNLEEKLKSADFGSDEFKRLSKELIKARKNLKNTELSLEALDSEQVASELGGVAGAVGDVTAAFVLLGGSDGAVAETAANIEKGIGISMAFKGAIEGIQSGMKLFNNLIKTNTVFMKADAIATKMASRGMKMLGISVKSTSRSFKVLKTAIVSSGIGALVLVLGEVASMTMDWMDSSEDLEKELEQLTQKIKEYREETTKLNTAIDSAAQKDIIRAKIRKATDAEIQQIETDAIKEKLKNFIKEESILKLLMARYHDDEQKLEKIRDSLAEATRNRLQAKNDFELKLLDNQYEAKLKQWEEEQKIEAEKAKLEAEKAEEKEKADALRKQRAATERQAAFELLIAKKKVDAEETISQQEKLAKYIAIENLKLQFILKHQDLTKSQILKKEFETEQAILKLQREFKLKELQENKQHQQNLDNIRNEFLNELEAESEIYRQRFLTDQEKEIEAVEDKYFRLKELAIQHGEDITELVANEEAEKKEIREAAAGQTKKADGDLNDLKIQAVRDTLTTINNLAILFAGKTEEQQRKAFKLQKGVAIAGAMIDTYQSAVRSYNSLSGIPGVGPILGFAAAAAAITAGMVNIKHIREQEFQGGGSMTPSTASTSMGGTGAESQPPAFNVVGQSGFNQIVGALGQQQQQPIQAFVVSGDVTTAQQLENNIIQTATF
jgi:hypothetical protein